MHIIIISRLFQQHILLQGGGVKSATNSPNGKVNYIFNSNGTFTVTLNGSPVNIKVLLVGAGGPGGAGQQGGSNNNKGTNGGGGGGGQVLETPVITITSTTTFNIIVGTSNIAGVLKDGSSTLFYNSNRTIAYDASGGGYGASSYASSNGGGGSTGYQTLVVYNTNNSKNIYNSYTSGSGTAVSNWVGYGGGGAGAGGSGSNGSGGTANTIVNNGGVGVLPSNDFVNNIYYGCGGSTYVGGISSTSNSFLPTIDSATIWNNVNYSTIIINSQYLINAPSNTGFGGIGGGWFYRDGTAKGSYNIVGGKGGSGICIIAIM